MDKIAILTWHYYNNFGSALQAYALQEAVKEINPNVEVLNYQNKLYSGKPVMRVIQKIDFLYNIVCSLFNRKRSYKFYHFRKKYLRQTKLFQNADELKKAVVKYQSVIVGSDQIWAPNVFNPIYMLDFVNGKETRKISYAASIGLEKIPDELSTVYQNLLSDFSFISVRESQGKKLLSDKCSIEARVVLDPTLLIDAEKYKKIMLPVDLVDDKYVFCYFLNENNEYRKQVEDYAQKHGLKIFGFSANPKDDNWLNSLSTLSPLEFLWVVDKAKAVFTDSYHGTIFSLLFHKEFFVFERFTNNDPICQNSRIRQLCDTFNISDRILVNEKCYAQCQEYDYDYFEKRLAEEKKSSLNYLREALK